MREYQPYMGVPTTYGQSGEHLFFKNGQDPAAPQVTPSTGGSPAYQAAMKSLAQFAEGGNDNGGPKGENAPRDSEDPGPGPVSLGNSTIGSLLGMATGVLGAGTIGGAIGAATEIGPANAIAKESMVDPKSVNSLEAIANGALGPFGSLLGLRSAYEQNFDNLAGNMALRDRPDLDAAWAEENDDTDAAARDAARDAIAREAQAAADTGGYGPGVGGDMGRDSDPSSYAGGGAVDMHDGGFVIPADVVSGLGDGSTKAGYRKLGLGQLIEGPGTGQSDDIPANIDGSPEAKVADGEVYLNPKEVELLGGGNHAKGMQRLYALLDEVRKNRHGTTKQPKPLSLGAFA